MILSVALLASAIFTAGPEQVEAADLAHRPDLVGREVVVDDRVRYFLESRRGQGYDLVLFKRTEIPFRLPAKLKYNRPPFEGNARIRGLLRSEDGRLIVDATTIEMFPPDLERLEAEIGKVRRDDFQSLRTWGLWAERRGKELNDPKLAERGIALETEALWSEAGRPDADLLGLVARTAGRPIASAVRNALAHRGFRDRFARAATVVELDSLARQIEGILPASLDPKSSSGPAADADTLRFYAKDPAEAYRDAPPAVQPWLDRRLLADVIQRSLERQVEASPADAAKLTEIARTRLPDRPELADRLGKQALSEAESRVATMRQSEVEELAQTFRDRGDDLRARGLLRNWLNDRRKNRLSASDAEGRIMLAANYDKMLGDRATAAELLREALVLDPASKPVVEAFLRMGYRRGDAGWYDPEQNTTDLAERVVKPEKAGVSGESETLKGLTRAQVRSRLGGKPDQIIRTASQGRCIEQWIYKTGKGMQVVRFIFDPGTTEPRASNHYSEQK